MTVKVAINGFGRIGRNILRSYYERPELANKIKLVAINDLGDVHTNAHLTQYDSVHGTFGQQVNCNQHELLIGKDKIAVLAERQPDKLPWQALGVDIVFECTGLFTSRDKAVSHLNAGAKKVLISAPAKEVDATIVYGVNHHVLTAKNTIVSNASCTTNCLAPLVKPLHDALGIVSGFVTTVHAYTNDQKLSDVYHSDLYRARSATQSMIPTKTGAATAIGLVIPELAGKLDGIAVRIPTVNVSLVDFVLVTKNNTTIQEVNDILKKSSENDLAGILNYVDKPLVSIDFNHNPYSSNFDASHTHVKGNLVKVMAWYDNEWGFSNRMLDTGLALFHAQ